jgi:O-antigen/teichoic acid export membrane protein
VLDRIGRNVLSNWSGLGVTMAVAFFMSPFLVRTLGDAQYGIWVLILSVTGYMGLLDAGLKVSVVKFVASLAAAGDDKALGSVISTALAIYAVLSGVLLAVSVAAGFALGALVEMPSDLRAVSQLVLFIASGTLSVTLLASVFNGFFAGLQRYDITNAVGIGTTVIGAVLIWLAVTEGFGIVGLGVVHLILQSAAGLLLWRIAVRFRPKLRVGTSQVSLAMLKKLYGYSFFVLLNSLAMLLLFRSGELVAGTLFGAAAITYFAIGGMLVEYLGRIVGSMTQVLLPLASSQHILGDDSGLRSVLLLSTRACLAIALPACTAFILLGTQFIARWMGPEYASVSGPILTVLAIARLVWLAQSGAGNILLGGGRHRQLTFITGVTGIVGIILAILAAGRYGLIGVAIGIAASIVIFQGILMPAFICQALRIPLRDYVSGAVAGPVLAVIPFAAVMYVLVRIWAPAGYGGVVAVAAACAPIYLGIAWFTCLDRDQRSAAAGWLAKRFANA